MKKLVACLMAGGMLLAAVPAFAQADKVPTQFVEIEGLFIGGVVSKDNLIKINTQKAAEFDAVSQLQKHSFMPKIQESAQEMALH